MITPAPLMTSEMGSYARSTIVERKPQILREVLAENDYPVDVALRLEEFKKEIASSQIKPLEEDIAEAAEWNAELRKYRGKTWLEVPWYFAETYFYRRLLEAVRYFQPGVLQYLDPFNKAKQRQMEKDVKRLSSEWDGIYMLPPAAAFETLIYSSLWGNRADLSNFDIRQEALSGLAAGDEYHHILINHTSTLHGLLSQGAERIDFINDNMGADILFDLALADFLLGQGWVRKIIFHLKNQPFFVSDAMPADVRAILLRLQSDGEAGARWLGERLASYIESGRLILDEDSFWTSWKMFSQMPGRVFSDLAGSDLVFLKGDVNYRRLLDDAHWPHTTRLEEAAAYFPAPLVTIRTLKGEIMVGLQPGQAEGLSIEDPEWLINGKRGLIQYVSVTHTKKWNGTKIVPIR